MRIQITLFFLLIFSCVNTVYAQAIGPPNSEAAREQARQMAREARTRLEEVMERLQSVKLRVGRVNDMARATNNFDAAIASVAVLPPAERRELDSMIEQIFFHYSQMLQISNEHANQLNEQNCRQEIDAKSQPAYQRGVARFEELRSIPDATTNKEQLASAAAYSLFFGTFAHFQIPMVLRLCASCKQ